MILVRTGPRFLFLKGSDRKQISSLLETVFEVEQSTFAGAFEDSKEGDTILIVVETEQEKDRIDESTPAILVKLGSSLVLLSLFNRREFQNIIEQVEMGPGFLIMKTPPPAEKIVEKVKKEYSALEVQLEEAIRSGRSEWSVLGFTESPLSRPIRTPDLLKTNLLIKKELPAVYRELRRQAVKYITEELEEGVWHEIKINIYDSKEFYSIHYQRVAAVIEDLEIGLILGETWSVDHPFVLMSVPVFQVQLFTYLKPLEVKKIMMSLEYDANGSRVADIDLYYRNRKIQWLEIDKGRKKSRIDEGLVYREQYLSGLTADAKNKLVALEAGLEKDKGIKG